VPILAGADLVADVVVVMARCKMVKQQRKRGDPVTPVHLLCDTSVQET
jgi:hypothetical protein